MVTPRQTAVGVFYTHAAAQQAMRRLQDAGFPDDRVGLVAQDPEQRYHSHQDEAATEAGTGAAAGAATGAGVGALWGLGILAGVLPAIGPVIAGGALASVLASAAAAAAAGGLLGALIGLGIPEEEAHYYDREFQGGRTIVTVREPTRYAEAQRIMRESGAYDFETRETEATSATRVDPGVRYEDDITRGTHATGTNATGTNTGTNTGATTDARLRR